ncbi:hypothetical protein ACFL0M_04960 [Thermodesulfobacteriota bacterium]
MFDEFLPKRKIGLLSPLLVVSNAAYEYYRLVPEGIMFVMLPIGLREFTPKDVERVFAPLEEYLTMLVERGVDIVVQSGVPLPILVGLEYHDKLLARIEKATGLPATSTVLSVVAAARSLGIQNIALANKWNPTMNKVLGMFFEREGIQIAGISSQSMVPSDFQKMKTKDSLTLAYELGRGALENNPEADGLFIGGGAWLTFPIIEPLEKEFGKPVVTNKIATIWHTCHLLDCWKPIQGYGRLFQSM